MLTEIRLTNFKYFQKETPFPLSKINLLTGINGRGKSSLLQALLLMKQSVEHNEYTNEIILNGNCVNLGQFEDIKNKDSENEEITFSFSWDKNKFIEYTLQRGFHKKNCRINTVKINDENKMVYDGYFLGTEEGLRLKNLLPEDKFCNYNFNNIHYIPADRLGAKNNYEKYDLPKEQFITENNSIIISPKFISITKKGENLPSILSSLKSNKVFEKLVLQKAENQLTEQTGAWLSKIFDTNIELKIYDSYRSAIEMTFRFNGKKEEFLPTNVGFGYSYILPIIVSGLIAKKDEILIIENPEAHLHPKAQHELTKFLAKVASCGVQILLESHSEHILNALRITAIDKPEKPKILEKEDVNILYFDNSEKHFQQIKIMEDNDLSAWLPDFFDQTNKDYNTIYDY